MSEGNRREKPGGTDDRFLSSVRLLWHGEGLTDHEERWSVPPLGHPNMPDLKFHDIRSSENLLGVRPVEKADRLVTSVTRACPEW